MAEITLSELYDLIKKSPDYGTRWRLDVDAEEALVIRLSSRVPRSGLTSKTFATTSGLMVVLDVDEHGTVWQIELA